MGITNLLYKPVQAFTFGLNKAIDLGLYATGGNNLINMANYFREDETQLVITSVKTRSIKVHAEKLVIVENPASLSERIAGACSELPFLAAKVVTIATLVGSQFPTKFEKHSGFPFPSEVGTLINQTLSSGKEIGMDVFKNVTGRLPNKEIVIEFTKKQAYFGLDVLQQNAKNATLIGAASLLTLSGLYDFHKMNETTVTEEVQEDGVKVTTFTQKSGYEKLGLALSGVTKLGFVASGIAAKQTGLFGFYSDLEKAAEQSSAFANSFFK